jgi:hypothetical protein
MNSKFIATAVVALAALSSANAFAARPLLYGEFAEFKNNTSGKSIATRDQVKAEYLVARQNGTMQVGQEFDVMASAPSSSNLTRAQVKAEYLVARQNHNLQIGQEFDVMATNTGSSKPGLAQLKSEILGSGTTGQNKPTSNAM